MSIYSQPCGGNASCGGDDLVALTRQEAFDWCQERGLTDTIEEFFSDMVEDA